MATQEVSFSAPAVLHEILVAELSEIGFGAFEARGDVIHAFAQVRGPDPDLDLRVRQTLTSYGLKDSVTSDVHPPRNWNAEWESTITPVKAGPFIVAPSWVDLEPHDAIPLRIDPKMSFGTGHHASTRLALSLLARHIRRDDRVLDAGTGTGILAIAAIKLGARRAIGFDVDPLVEPNFGENALRNGVADCVAFVPGTVTDVPEDGFDLLVANISRNVLLDSLQDFTDKVRPGGRVVLAGLLRGDRGDVRLAAACTAMFIESEIHEEEWWACVLVRPDVDGRG